MGHVDLELAEQIEGQPKTWSPYLQEDSADTDLNAANGTTGGIGYEGLAQIQHFIEDGGLMVTLGSGTCWHWKAGWCALQQSWEAFRGVRRRRWTSSAASSAATGLGRM